MTSRLFFACLIAAAFCGACKHEVSESEAQAGKKEYVFGIIAKSNNNPVFQAARQGAEDAAKELGEKHGLKIRVEWRTPDQENAQMQAQYLEQLTLSHVDGIGISCSDASMVTSTIDAAVAAGVPVMCWDSDAAASKRFCFHGVDDDACGRSVMNELAAAMGGKGVVAILAGNENAPNLQARVRGAKEAAAKFAGITIKDVYFHAEDTQSAAAKVEQVQTANPDIEGWAMIGGWPLFSDAILKNPAFAGGKVKIVAVDALPESLPYVREGIAVKLLAQQVYQWGYRAVEILLDKAAFGKTPPSERDIAELMPVTKENVDAYAKNWEKWLPR